MEDTKASTAGKVLLVEDDPAQRRLMQMSLETEGFIVSTAKSGEECLALVGTIDPDVVLIDINMPGMDGIETCRRLKQMPEVATIPVVLVTGQSDDDPTTVEALRAGGNDFISKDASAPVLYTRVRCQITINRAQRQLRRLAMTDELTGLSSRRFLFDSVRRLLKTASRHPPRGGVSCILADLDHFKKINDTKGHSRGDEALRQLATVIKECTRETDIAARFGGEEFVLILPDTPVEGAMILAEKIRVTVEQRCATTVSIGVAIAELPPVGSVRTEQSLEEDMQRLIHEADLAMYASKTNGRNRVTRFSPQLVKP